MTDLAAIVGALEREHRTNLPAHFLIAADHPARLECPTCALLADTPSVEPPCPDEHNHPVAYWPDCPRCAPLEAEAERVIPEELWIQAVDISGLRPVGPVDPLEKS